MRNVCVFHGVEGSPAENWFPWLQKELKYNSCNVLIPQFPTPNGQTLTNWLEAFDKCKNQAGIRDEDLRNAIFVGHSLGGLFMLSLLEKYRVKAAVFVASFASLPGNNFDEGMRTFAPSSERDLHGGRADFDWGRINENCGRFFVYHSDDDPYVKLGTAQQLARNLHTKLILVRGAGHFNGSAGYIKFPLLLADLKKILRNEKS